MKTIEGYAAVFNRPSVPMVDGPNRRRFIEYLSVGCFRDSIARDEIKLLVGHDAKMILGSTTAKTLKLWEDSVGLRFECKIDEHITYANDIYLAIQRGDIWGCSFQIIVPNGQDKWAMQSDGTWRRDVYQVTIPEITITGFPAYLDTICNARCSPAPIESWMSDDMRKRVEYINGLKARDNNSNKLRQHTVALLKKSL